MDASKKRIERPIPSSELLSRIGYDASKKRIESVYAYMCGVDDYFQFSF